MIDYITRNIRAYFTGKDAIYEFRKTNSPKYAKIESTNLYIHVPFCNNLCPYCPYFKIKYDNHKAPVYLQALINEIDLYHHFFGRLNISSIYIGGGTPALLMDELSFILKYLQAKFYVTGNICIEVSPKDVTKELITKLKDNNIRLVSVGAQSFLNKHLDFIGRKYQSSEVDNAIEQLLNGRFESINVDLLFALPEQNVPDVRHDLDRAVENGINQITTYPLFTFPYTSIGRYLKLKKVKMPNLFKRQRQYYFIHNYLADKGFKRVSVWSFKRGDVPRYSSVTRDQYIGLGAGAGSHLPDGFYLNTFSFEDYVKKCLSREFPIASHMRFTESMHKYFWLYWRFYDTHISKTELSSRFDPDDARLNRLFSILRHLGLLRENGGFYELTLRGSFWIHLMQNFFSLRYINEIWSKAMQEAYPESIPL